MAGADSHDTTADRVQSSAAVSFLHPTKGVMLPVLDLDPVLGPTGLIGPILLRELRIATGAWVVASVQRQRSSSALGLRPSRLRGYASSDR